MKNIEIDAIGTFEPGEYGTVEVNGVGSCHGAVSAQSLEINGVLKCGGAVKCDRAEINGTMSCTDRLDAGEMEINGAVKVNGTAGVEKLEVDGGFTVTGDLLECDTVECDGGISVKGDIKARTLETDGTLKAEGSIAADEITVDGTLQAEGNIEADQVTVDGLLKAGGQVSADHVHVEGGISAAEVVGDEVVIWRKRGNGFHCVIKVGGKTIEINRNGGEGVGEPSSRVGLIEATTIALQNVEADTVNGTDVTIGPGCVIEHLDCNGVLRIDPAAQVKSITGEYTQVDD